MNSAFAWHSQQQTRVTRYKAPKHEIPTDWNCAGECSQPVPDPPVEAFRNASTGPAASLLVVLSIVTLAFIGMYRR